jgi:hypothetical protein
MTRLIGRRSRADRACVVGLAALVVALWLPRLSGPIDLRWDAGVYYVLGTSLQQGKAYRLLSEPGELRAVQYPPGLPLVVAAHQVALRTEDPAVVGRALRWTFALLTLAFVLLAYALARSWLPPRWALAVGVMVAVHPWTLFMSDSLFAEVPFGVALLGFLLVCRSVTGWRGEVAAGLLTTTAFLLRTLGVALMAAWVLEAVLRRRFGVAALRLVVAALPVVAWQGYVQHVRGCPEYTQTAYEYQRAPYLMYNVSYAENMALFDPFDPRQGPATPERVARRSLKHALLLPRTLGEMVSVQDQVWRTIGDRALRLGPDGRKRLAKVMELGLGLLVIAGLVVLLRRRERLTVLVVVATLGLICLTAWSDQFVRYLTPLIPILATCLIVAVRAGVRAARGRGATASRVAVTGAIGVAAVVGLSQLAGLLRMYLKAAGQAAYRDAAGVERTTLRFYYEEAWADFRLALAWLRDAAEEDAIVVTTAPHWTYLESGRRAVQPPRADEPAEAQRLLDTVPTSYVIVDGFQYSGGNLARDFTPPAIDNHPDLWRRVFQTPNQKVSIYARVGRGAP